MTTRRDHSGLPATPFAQIAAELLLAVNYDAMVNETAERFVAGVADENSRRSLAVELDGMRGRTELLADLYRLVIALEPVEPVVRALPAVQNVPILRHLLEGLHHQSQRAATRPRQERE